MRSSTEAARRDGRLPNDDVVLVAHSSVLTGGSAQGTRAIDIRAWRGIDLRILPDRGFDLAQAWFGGQPLAWVSGVGETGPLTDLDGFRWSDGFGGGLMVTCGLRNVGMPGEGHGLHGTASHLPAVDVDITRTLDAEEAWVSARARVVDPGDVSDDAVLELTREIRTHAFTGRVEITDRTTNQGREPTPAPILYHFNFGFPLWGPGAHLAMAATETWPRDEESRPSLEVWDHPPPPTKTAERVLEHRVEIDDGWGKAVLGNELLGVELLVRWRAAELPRLHQWIDPSPGRYVLGIEPANCSTRGRAVDRAEGRLPMLEPGGMRETRLVVEARRV